MMPLISPMVRPNKIWLFALIIFGLLAIGAAPEGGVFTHSLCVKRKK